jgi:decaprenylphospho-beta-D-ribofuranose 2-oxidase
VKVHGWGRYPVIEADIDQPRTATACRMRLDSGISLIPRGLGRSYGDSALAEHILETRQLHHFHEFDTATGVLTCAAGVSLAEVLALIVPRGWFLAVTPGTKFVTVGGAIASDVHGKNHHLEGTFGEYVLSLRLLLGNGEIVSCSPTEHPELFRATCGGMGLTGVIVAATIRLKQVQSSSIVETILKADHLEKVVELFEANSASTYSVAWTDCLASGKALGRSLLMLGEHAEEGALEVAVNKAVTVPLDMPAVLLNRRTIAAFNTLYYQRIRRSKLTRRVSYERYFYPLDKLRNWNRLYGKPGFLQYQFALPKQSGSKGLKEILQRIASSGKGSFLAVLKAFGPANLNLLSFPIEGYTLALDFRNEPSVFPLLEDLDQRVLHYGGRLYLSKDARMSEATFKRSYVRWQEFEEVRGRFHALGHFASLQSKRLGLQ